jgi:serine/threonine protein kinase
VLEEATNQFDEQKVIGTGGFGKFYKAVMQGGCKIAIKWRNMVGSSQGNREFQAEIELLSRVQHLHVVSLIGYCNERRLQERRTKENTPTTHKTEEKSGHPANLGGRLADEKTHHNPSTSITMKSPQDTLEGHTA